MTILAARFVTRLVLEPLLANEAFYELRDELVYASRILDRVLTVPVGFHTDLDSTPRYLPLAYAALKGTGKPAACVHDLLYQCHRADPFTFGLVGGGWHEAAVPVSRAVADAVYAEALGALGVPAWKAWCMYRAVRLGGRRSYVSGPTRWQVNNAHMFAHDEGGAPWNPSCLS